MAAIKQLAGLDASFLFLETEQMPMHVGALHVLELPAGFEGRFVDALRAHLKKRMPHLPALRRRLASVGLNLVNPAWVDAQPDLDQHVVSVELPAGSGLLALEDAVARLHPQLLPRDRPLWKFHVFEDLAPSPDDGARRVALYTQLHHAAVDGQAAVALAAVILDLGPVPRELPDRPLHHRPEAGTLALMRGALMHQAQQVLNIARSLPGTLGTLGGSAGDAGAALLGLLKGKSAAGSPLKLAPRTRFNQSVSATRSFATVSLPLAELHKLRKQAGASLNDAVLYLCGTALRQVLLEKHELPRKPLVAAVPVSLRAAGDTASNNQATMSTVTLGTHIADPRKRLAHVLAASQAMKGSLGTLKQLMPLDFPSLGLPWLMAGAARLYGAARAAEKLPALANVAISNVPGPQQALYLAGARMVTNYPSSIVVHGMALNITVQSYGDSLEFGLMACGKALPDVARLAGHLRAALAEWQSLGA
ncbi:wax ester/triacylglycerol synthase family O-acyltransferase [Pelomonas sp. SE-A7]|uniref:wax ester/triacylglycerol synthase family O-acyltransferase n=1 Tax=Pelomonas sp. SE-A7 TaxID=3054953 RepID=UPI00259C87EB|nr:wax ester/triacylglycerol synthase family O-acyltransferase [Pelomonas sp. SE-A7]MDM4768508.1 wax ester/triacylglycerol synthase family O-acyltransferase [Pelomonas sp. SE-A7]